MIVFNQIEQLKNLYRQLKYEEVIQFAPITLRITLQEKRYEEALLCYEYLATAYHEKGDFEVFVHVMADYEKLSLTHGTDENKLVYYCLMSLLKIMVREYEDATDFAKKSIRYAYLLKNEEMVFINFANIAAQNIFLGKKEEAKMAERFASYYKEKLPKTSMSLVRGLTGLLYYYAMVGNEQVFKRIKREMQELLNNEEAYANNRAHLSLGEAILFMKIGDVRKSEISMGIAYKLFKVTQNIIHLRTIYRMLNYSKNDYQVDFYDELEEYVGTYQFPLSGVDRVKSLQSDLFLHEASHSVTFKYPNIVTKEQMEQHVTKAITNKQQVYCLHWSFMTDGIEELFGHLFEQQFLLSLFDVVIEAVAIFDAELLMPSKNEGEVIIVNISQEAFFCLLIELEQKLYSVFVQSTIGRVDIPVHFGFISTDELPQDRLLYEELAAHADASLYYAKSRGQLYIYS